MYIARIGTEKEVLSSLKKNPVTALLGPRQCGKTTLVKQLLRRIKGNYFDLENPADEARLQSPQIIFDSSRGVIILDEIQRKPDILPLIRVYADEKPLKLKFLLLGSASPELIKNSSESLAGRVHFVEMSGFSIKETGEKNIQRLWLRGGFPRSFAAKSEKDSIEWRNDFIRTFVERDIFQYGINIPSGTLRRFWSMASHYHGQIWNSSELGNSMGISHVTARKYLDVLCGAYMARQLLPYYENMGKRLVKSPKIYLRDSGIFHSLMNITSFNGLQGHPKLGASWEGFALEQIIGQYGEKDAYFWATIAGAELDLLLIRNGRKYGFEFKYSGSPLFTKSMHIAVEDLKLDHLWVIYPGRVYYKLNSKCSATPLSGFTDHVTL